MGTQCSTNRSDTALAIILGALLLLFLYGCGQKGVRTIGRGVTPSAGQTSKEELREQLDTFREFFRATLRQAANDLNEQAPTRRTEKTTLQMRTQLIQGLSAMLNRDDPIVAFIETWALCTRFRMYLEEGEGSSLFGDNQKLAINSARSLEAEIERIGRVFLKNDIFETAHNNVNQFAQSNVIRGVFSNVTAYATEAREDRPNPFLSVLKVPMSPFRAMEGVDRTASAIRQFRDTAERFSDIVAEMPESTRWQLQLLLFELEETEMVKSFLNSFQRFTESSSRLEASVKKLPENLRIQLTQFTEETDRKQEELQKTLQQAEKTTLAVNTTLEKLDKVAGSLEATAASITITTQSWESAAKATGQIVEQYNKSKQSSQEKESEPFDINEYRVTAEQISQTANDIQNLLAAVDDFPNSRGTLSLMNRLSFRVAGLILFIFVLAVLYRIITIRLVRTKGNNAA